MPAVFRTAVLPDAAGAPAPACGRVQGDDATASAGDTNYSLPCSASCALSDSVSQQSLREMRDRLQALFDGVETGIFVIDPATHRIVDANPVALSLVGASREKVVGAVCHRFICPADAGRCPVTDLGQTVDNSERALLTFSGERRAIVKTVRLVEMGGHPYLLESFFDVTDLKRAEQSLAEQTAYLNTLIEVSPMGIAVFDPAGHVRLCNNAFEKLFLYSRRKLQGASLWELIVPADMADESSRYAQACLNGESLHFTTRRRRRDGTILDVEIYAVPLTVPGKPSEVLALYHDITERRRVEADMEERHRLATLTAEIGVALTGAEDLEPALQACVEVLIRHMHIACARIWTMREKDGLLELVAAAGTLARIGADDARLREAFDIEHIAVAGEAKFVDLPGNEPWLGDPQWASREHLASFAACPLKVGEQILGVACLFARKPLTDAARQAFTSLAHSIAQFVERKRAEASLRASEDRFRTAFEDAPYGTCMSAPNGRFLHANAALCRMLGYSQEQLLAGAWPQLTHPDDLERSRHAAEQFLRGEIETMDMEKRYICCDGRTLWARVRIVAARDSAGGISHFITQIEDITLRKLAEDRLRASEERYRELFENASDLVCTFDLDLSFTSINRLAEKTLGYSRDEVLGMSLYELADPSRCDAIRAGIARIVAGDPPSKFEIDVRTKENRRVALEVSPRLIRRDTTPIGIQTIARDITGRDLAEMEIRQAQKLESVGRLAAGIAHEINTPMQFVGDNVRFVHDSFQEILSLLVGLRAFCENSSPSVGTELRTLLEKINLEYLLNEIPEALAQTQEGIDRVVTIVCAMKEFAHPESRGHARADLNKALLNTLTVARNELKYVADVETDFGELPMVVCSVSDLNQVFLNLLVNAAHAIGDTMSQSGGKGKIRIRTESQGDQILITISDNGSGIPESIRDRIFDPFFTTKEVGRGTGQGLAISRAVIDRHNGSLTFESQVGRGTAFFIRLPVEGS